MFKLVVVDLDGTLLRSDKSISDFTLKVLKECRNRGLFIAIATARSEISAQGPIAKVQPDIIISSSGALVSYRGDYIYSAGFSDCSIAVAAEHNLGAISAYTEYPQH